MRQVGYESGLDWQAPQAPGRGPDASTSRAHGGPVRNLDAARNLDTTGLPRAAAAIPDRPLSADGFHLPSAAGRGRGRMATRGAGRSAARPHGWHPSRWLAARTLPLLLLTAFAGLSGGLLYNMLTDGGRQSRVEQRFAGLLPDLDSITDALGLGLDQTTLSGQHFTADSDVFDALQLGKARSLLRFDSVAARERIERLPWVESASITRIFPGRVAVDITERAPFALWQSAGRHVLVDRGGRELSAADPRDYAALPRIAGEGAPAEAAQLLALVARYPLVASRLDVAERVDGRRWRLRLKGDVVLELPAEREAPALDQVTQGGNIARLIAAGGRIIDLRSPGRIAVRRPPRSAATVGSAASRQAESSTVDTRDTGAAVAHAAAGR